MLYERNIQKFICKKEKPTKAVKEIPRETETAYMLKQRRLWNRKIHNGRISFMLDGRGVNCF